MKNTLHDETFARIPWAGGVIQRQLQKRSTEMARLARGMPDPDVSIVIRSRNDGALIKQLFEDIHAQDFGGKIEIIVVDTESNDDTAVYARAQGAKVIPLKQSEFTYPLALNLAFKAAKYPYVFTLVGHSNLTNRLMLKSLTYWCQHENFGGVYALPLVNKNGSIWERLDSMWSPLALRRAHVLKRASPGMLGANGSIVKRAVWEQLGGYDERYAGGGEDAALARSMLEAGFMIVREPLCTFFHSHGLGFVNHFKQLWHWIEVGRPKPKPFETSKIHARRPDLR